MSEIEIDLDFVKADKECIQCDHVNDYVCFDHEEIQVRDKFPDAKYRGLGVWYREVDERE